MNFLYEFRKLLLGGMVDFTDWIVNERGWMPFSLVSVFVIMLFWTIARSL